MLELYWSRPLKNIRGVRVYVTRLAIRFGVNEPCGSSIQLIAMLGSTDHLLRHFDASSGISHCRDVSIKELPTLKRQCLGYPALRSQVI